MTVREKIAPLQEGLNWSMALTVDGTESSILTIIVKYPGTKAKSFSLCFMGRKNKPL